MTREAKTDPDAEASGSYGDLFRAAANAEEPEPRLAVPDDSEAAMKRLRAPFDVQLVDAVEPRG